MMWILVAALAAANTSTECTSLGSKGPDVAYSAWGKSGGAHPAPATVMAREIWTVGGVEVFRRERPYSEPERRTPDLDWAWDEAKTTEVKVLVDERTTRRVRYRTAVRLYRPSGESLGEGLASELTVALTCEREELYGLP